MPKEFVGLSCMHVGTGEAGTIAMLGEALNPLDITILNSNVPYNSSCRDSRSLWSGRLRCARQTYVSSCKLPDDYDRSQP